MADRHALSRATDSSDSPTPGYLYLDIAKAAATSPAACTETATYLTRRLSSKSNHNIKYKCLKVITQVAASPVTRGQFKRAIAQDPNAMSAVKEALQFRGPPDPVRGDEIYARVRTAAKEALDSIYSDDPSSNAASYSSANAGLGGGAVGYGGASSSYSGGGGYSGGGPPSDGPRRMEGIGNPMYKDPRNEPAGSNIGSMTIGEAVSVAGETLVGMIKDPLAKNVASPSPNQNRSASMPGYGAPSAGGYGGSAPPFAAEIARQTGGEYSGASNRGPNAVVPSNYDRDSSYYKKPSNYDWAKQSSTSGAPAPSGVGGSWGSAPVGGTSIATQAREPPMQNRQASYGAPQHSGTIGSATGGVAASDGTYEKNLIMDLCPAGGMKAEPPADKLAAFVRSVPSLNSDLVCPALLDCLEDGQPWIIKAKALCVIEATIGAAKDAALANGAADGANAYSDFFHACAGEIEPLASHPRPAIREPARRVLKSLGIEFTANGEGGASAAARRRKAPVAAAPAPVEPPNLLDFGDVDSTPAVTTAAAPAPQPAPAQPVSSGGGSLFGGLNTKDAPTPVAAPASQQQAPPTDDVQLLLGDPEPAQAPISAGGGGGGLFGDITVKVKAPTNDNAGAVQDVAGASASNGSAFGFINSGGGGDSEKATAPPSSTPQKTFDPLEGLDTSSSQQQPANASQMSAQMQAMAYQQNMMMMQQQMQQMQMAMAMQQQQMGGTGGANMMRQSMPAAMPSHPMNPHVMQSHLMKQTPGHGDASSSFSFLDGSSPVKKKEIKSFDFVKDAMKDAK